MNTLIDLVSKILGIGTALVPLFFILAFIGFAVGAIKYIFSADPGKIDEARRYILYSIISIAAMLSIFGMALLVKNTFFPDAKSPLSCNSGLTSSSSIITNFINQLVNAGNYMVPLLIGIAFLAFIWGVIRYLYSADPKKIAEAKNYMIFSIVGITAVIAIFGLAFLVKRIILPGSPSSVGCTQSPSSSNTIRYCAGSYTTGQACNHGNGNGICRADGECII